MKKKARKHPKIEPSKIAELMLIACVVRSHAVDASRLAEKHEKCAARIEAILEEIKNSEK